jgi:tyrosyl-tRNA synthetase
VACIALSPLTRNLQADVHGMLDALKNSIELIDARSKYYQFIIRAMLESVGVPTEKLEFVLGSSYQTSSPYCMDGQFLNNTHKCFTADGLCKFIE